MLLSGVPKTGEGGRRGAWDPGDPGNYALEIRTPQKLKHFAVRVNTIGSVDNKCWKDCCG